MDRQTGEDANFRIRSRNTWLDFIHFQEDRLHDSNNLIKKFTIAEATGTYNKGNKHILKIYIGLQDKEVDFKSEVDRTQERYVFDEHSIFDHKGKLMSEIDCLFFPQLGIRSTTPPLRGIT